MGTTRYQSPQVQPRREDKISIEYQKPKSMSDNVNVKIMINPFVTQSKAKIVSIIIERILREIWVSR